jgi:hypothetical protein
VVKFDLEQITDIYYSQKRGGNAEEPLHTLADVADKLGADYYQLCEFLHSQKDDINLHILSGYQAKTAHIQNGQYILDYYLVHKHSYEMLAVIFNYDNKSNIARVLRHARMFKPKGIGIKDTIRPVKIPYKVQGNDIMGWITFNDVSFNKAVWRMIENNDVPSRLNLPATTTIEVKIFKPIYEKLQAYLKHKNYNLDDFIASTFIRYLSVR